jgi:hypothetical protein
MIMKSNSLLVKIFIFLHFFCGITLAKEPPKESKNKQEIKVSNKKFNIKFIQIGQDHDDFLNLDVVKNSLNFKCENSNSVCTFENTILGVNASYVISFIDNKVTEIIVNAKSQRPPLDPAFLGDQLRDYLDSEYGNSEMKTEDFDIASWTNKYYRIFFTYSCLKENANEPEFIKSGCINDSIRKVNFAIQQSVMESGSLVQKISTYKWLAKDDSIIYEKARGKLHPKFLGIYKSAGYIHQGNWDILIVSKRNNTDRSIIKKRLNEIFSDKYFDDFHDLMEKDTGIQIRPSKIKKNDF